MFKARRTFLIISLLFIFGAFIASFFMHTSAESIRTGRGWTTVYTTNVYGTSVTSILAVCLTALIPAFIFSFFEKKGFYIPSIIINIVVFPLLILSVVFSGISIAVANDEAAAIVSTVFCGISIGAIALAMLTGFVALHRLSARIVHIYSKPSLVTKTYTSNQPQKTSCADKNLVKESGDIISYLYVQDKAVYQVIDKTMVKFVITNRDEFEIVEIDNENNTAKLRRISDGHVIENINLKDFRIVKKKVVHPKPEEYPQEEQVIETTESHSISEKERIELLRDYKELLDDGVITQEEFDKKKKKLLD